MTNKFLIYFLVTSGIMWFFLGGKTMADLLVLGMVLLLVYAFLPEKWQFDVTSSDNS